MIIIKNQIKFDLSELWLIWYKLEIAKFEKFGMIFQNFGIQMGIFLITKFRNFRIWEKIETIFLKNCKIQKIWNSKKNLKIRKIAKLGKFEKSQNSKNSKNLEFGKFR